MPEEDESLLDDAAVTVTQFLLKPDIPREEREYFKKFYVLFSKIAAVSNITREDLFTFKLQFKIIAMLLENGLYDYAHELMAEYLMTLQLYRSVNGFWTLYGQRGVERVEQINIPPPRIREPRKSFTDTLKSFFGIGSKTETESEELGEIEGGE